MIPTQCTIHTSLTSYYRTWENFGVGKNWRIWQIEGHSPIFTLQLIQISAFANVLPRQNFPTYGI